MIGPYDYHINILESAVKRLVSKWVSVSAMMSFSIGLAACSSPGSVLSTDPASGNSPYDRGYRNGLAAGYYLLCGGERFVAEERFDEPDFFQGYERGISAGQTKCKLERQ